MSGVRARSSGRKLRERREECGVHSDDGVAGDVREIVDDPVVHAVEQLRLDVERDVVVRVEIDRQQQVSKHLQHLDVVDSKELLRSNRSHSPTSITISLTSGLTLLLIVLSTSLIPNTIPITSVIARMSRSRSSLSSKISAIHLLLSFTESNRVPFGYDDGRMQ